MEKGVFRFIANQMFSLIGHCKVISCKLIINKLREHLSLVCDVLECEKKHILIKVDLCGDIMLYKININDRDCVEYVECIGEVGQ